MTSMLYSGLKTTLHHLHKSKAFDLHVAQNPWHIVLSKISKAGSYVAMRLVSINIMRPIEWKSSITWCKEVWVLNKMIDQGIFWVVMRIRNPWLVRKMFPYAPSLPLHLWIWMLFLKKLNTPPQWLSGRALASHSRSRQTQVFKAGSDSSTAKRSATGSSDMGPRRWSLINDDPRHNRHANETSMLYGFECQV